MIIEITGLSFFSIGVYLILKSKQELKKANETLSKAIFRNEITKKDLDESIKLTKKFNYLTRTVSERGILIKKLKTELYKPKPKKEKKEVDGVFIKSDHISDFEWKDGLLKAEIIDHSVKYLNVLLKLDKREK